jgi:class 3 adenylate cyclase
MSILLSLGVAEQVNRVNRASQLFVPKPVLSRLGHESIADVNLGDSIEAEMTVLFSDIRNFTTRSEQMSPSETFSFLNTYLAHMVPAIEKHGGLIDKYIGDAIMALFPDSADNALASAEAMQEAVRRLNDTRPPGQEPISIGIGLHRGRLMLGTVGDRNRLDVTVISDAVNVASRLESLTKEKDEAIIVSSDVVRTLRHPERFSLKQLGTTSIKGRAGTVEIWAVGTGNGQFS